MGESERPKKDLLAFVGGAAPDGSRLGVRRSGDSVEFGVLTPVEEGKPLPAAELLSITPSPGPWHEVETFYDGRPRKGGRPAMVNNSSFRSGWDAVFGGDKSTMN